jgi:phosphoglycerate dehydrogenase-like enzyme
MKAKKVVITEPMDGSGIEMLRREAEVIYVPQLPERSVLDEIGDAHALVVRVVEVSRELIAQGKNLLIIAKHGVG